MTDAGQRLLAWLQKHYQLAGYPLDKFVAAIEAEAAQEAPAPEGLRPDLYDAIESVLARSDSGCTCDLEHLRALWLRDRAALAAPPSPAEPPRRDEDRSDPLGIHAHERYGGPDVR